MPIYYVRPWPRYQGTLGHFPIRSGAFAGGGTLMEHWVRIPSAEASDGGIGVIMERPVRIPSGRQGSCPAGADRAAATGCVREIMGAPEKHLQIQW